MKSLFRRERDQFGMAAVEFALVLPILLALVFGIINFGVLLYNQSVITNAAREGARWAAIHNTATTTCTNAFSTTPVDACQVAYSYANNLVISFLGAPNLTVTQTSAGATTGAEQGVTVQYTYKGVAAYFTGANLDKNYTSTSKMLHE